MKKMFLDPDFEFVNIKLVANVVGASSVDEEELNPDQGQKPTEGFGDDWD